jgi:hypothetical protein
MGKRVMGAADIRLGFAPVNIHPLPLERLVERSKPDEGAITHPSLFLSCDLPLLNVLPPRYLSVARKSAAESPLPQGRGVYVPVLV